MYYQDIFYLSKHIKRDYMNRFVTIFIGFFLAGFLKISAVEADLFKYDRESVEQELSGLTQLEEFVLANEGFTLSMIQSSGNPLANAMTSHTFNPATLTFFEGPLGIHSFWWGCCFGVVGMAVVYFVTDDNDEVRKSFHGCIVGTIASVILYGVGHWTGLIGWQLR
jgi:hypothetical protein